MTENSFFNNDYESSRDHFRNQLSSIAKIRQDAYLDTYYIGDREDDNSVDILASDASSRKTLLTITAGEHGIEGYTGSALLSMFIENFLPHLNPETTGLRLVHSVNPWGMRHCRRVTENNVDMNRNYLLDFSQLRDRADNEYEKHKSLFNPEAPIQNLNKQNSFLLSYLQKNLTEKELERLKNTPGGQYKYPQGVFYGGSVMEETTRQLADRYKEWAESYDHIVHIDLHTGGGPMNELTMIFMDGDSRSASELQKSLGRKNVSKTNNEDVSGDSVEFLQKMIQTVYPEKRSVFALFEFGTIEESTDGYLFCAKAMINENQLHFEGARFSEDEMSVRNDFTRLFNPADKTWQSSIFKEAEKGFRSLLKSENLI
ncbi:M14 family metallopeptidase [Alkalicoccus halolimnae]|uniref:M14 family metallopeptidase n=1 Tax=Alkalicoccus halolimnae TaxID=1667239 RepID=A0A5C7FCS2_9BACI|nr:M14 family metallopeptidase [Alkalicoccus halolimnae]TXF85147.1 DUF2817 domain-containing protein [Alkalicoccus halolimnae]